MARSLSQTLIRTSNPSLFATKSPPTPHVSRIATLRNQSSQSGNPQIGDPNLVDSDSEQQREALAVQRIEDAIHRIIAKRSAPDWLPFVPGSSYWVPPRRPSYGIADLVQKLANTLTEEEVMSLTNVRGWPSSAYFVSDATPHPVEAETTSRNTSQTEEDDDE
ncbi:uncharacterized protein LOC132282630 [Cornus florida]|uniref:uncharacterized protein LOC132282630 n=1 Tax=Cornus florida TaxID=4283 RepID=UPI0028A096A7|nr:uncharacterized protein LOC132282630 [Cornus florida]XP_059640354.1 uncharacterized protein LOC132282630 [Cornus florida]XP_059640355.1 uncharacterized protein LOC132282630 [Cornus florida]